MDFALFGIRNTEKRLVYEVNYGGEKKKYALELDPFPFL